jgi:uncharacterized protein (DUF433 family)
MGGLPCIRGLRFPVATVMAMLADGMNPEDILAEHPDLTTEDIRESLLYAARPYTRTGTAATANGVKFSN